MSIHELRYTIPLKCTSITDIVNELISADIDINISLSNIKLIPANTADEVELLLVVNNGINTIAELIDYCKSSNPNFINELTFTVDFIVVKLDNGYYIIGSKGYITVQDLIDSLNKIGDRDMPVAFYNNGNNYEFLRSAYIITDEDHDNDTVLVLTSDGDPSTYYKSEEIDI